jgi:hypothetical protein
MVDYATDQDTLNEGGEHPTEPRLADIRQEWAWVKEGIEEVLVEQPQLTYRPEDIYAQCVNGDALLWVAPEGFVVSSGFKDEFNDKSTFLIWIAWAKQRGQNCAVKYYDFFAKNAAEAGYDKIETRTAVSQVERYLLSDGWRKEAVIFTREL